MPTSLTYIVLSTRGCSPWRPDAVMSTTRGANKSFPRIFKGRREGTGRRYKRGAALPGVEPSLQVICFQGKSLLKRKDNSSRAPRRRLRVRLRCRTVSTLWCGNINPLPFRLAGPRKAQILKELPNLLGSTNPCPIAVHKEPFSTSVFKVLI